MRDWPKQRTCIGFLRAELFCVDSIIVVIEYKDASKKILVWDIRPFWAVSSQELGQWQNDSLHGRRQSVIQRPFEYL